MKRSKHCFWVLTLALVFFSALTLSGFTQEAAAYSDSSETKAAAAEAGANKIAGKLKDGESKRLDKLEIAEKKAAGEADGKTEPPLADTADLGEVISAEQACQIALAEAGVNAEQLKFITVYTVWHEHQPYAYEVKFAENAAPYSFYRYTIDLFSGDVLSGGRLGREH